MARTLEVLLFGGSGRMGREIQNILKKTKEIKLGTSFGRDMNPNALRFKRGTKVVAIDFTSPEAFRKIVTYCTSQCIPLVTGTTGLAPKDFKQLKVASQKIPVLWSANMSIGIQCLMNIIDAAGPSFEKFDIHIEETHHTKKKDSPSGTALILKKAVERASKKKNIKIESHRFGQVIGEHKIILTGQGETICLEHSAKDRAIFARGAVQAAQWLAKQKRGMYDMRDFIRDE